MLDSVICASLGAQKKKWEVFSAIGSVRTIISLNKKENSLNQKIPLGIIW